jgi:hypothetical protein
VNNSGVIAGLISCVLATLGIISFGIIFVPLAFIVVIFGSINAIRNTNLSGIGINALAWILTGIGVITSPTLLATIGIATLISSSHGINNHIEPSHTPSASYQQRSEQESIFKEAILEQDKISRLAKGLDEGIAHMNQSGIPQASIEIESALAKLKEASRLIGESLQNLKVEADVTPMTCYHAEQKVRYQFEQKMVYNWEQLLGSANSDFRGAIGNLEQRLENGSRLVTKAQGDAQALDDALKVRRYAQGSIAIELGRERRAIEQYQSIMSSARTQLSTWRSEAVGSVERARQIMREGKSITGNALRSAHCNSSSFNFRVREN